MPAAAFDLLILANPQVTVHGAYTVLADAVEVGRFTVSGEVGDPIEVRIAVPRDARKLTLARKRMPMIAAMLGAPERTFDLVPVDGVTSPLRHAPPATSLASLRSGVDKLLAEIGWQGTGEDLGLVFDQPQSKSVLEAAELRLGFALDPQLKAALSGPGPLRLQDSRMTTAIELAPTDRQFVTLWGHAENVSAETLAIYRSSTMVWIEAGDGYGAVIYQPEGPQRCSAGPAYWRIHQEHIDSPQLILGRDGGCGGPSDALFPMFARELIERIEDEASETQLLVDRDMPDFSVWLQTDRNGMPRLRPDWSKLR
ncbi:hypothetical protein GIW81_15155 [Hyphomicrobium sp. xq]|uniref:Uncharacterized protein n=1 Tax=Hyphomicrobium album TaxID=2665159 RepID=A0A6I3KQ00_9HYPH|nr:hypothetical protein [Hyphomicrobium album]MTD95676.1 hypothetical protein [Hyphomicrobium album]